MDVTIVDDEEIHELNRQYRGMDKPTDVLSFALDEGEEDEPELIGGPKNIYMVILLFLRKLLCVKLRNTVMA